VDGTALFIVGCLLGSDEGSTDGFSEGESLGAAIILLGLLLGVTLGSTDGYSEG
jgi:hypothetical protein